MCIMQSRENISQTRVLMITKALLWGFVLQNVCHLLSSHQLVLLLHSA